MLVAIGYYAGDLDQAERLASWVKALGPYPGHTLLVARDRSTQARPFADVGFDSVEEIEITDDAWRSWPQSANNVFHKIHKHVEWSSKQPFLWLEPDVVPIGKGWLDAIEAEYKSAGKPFLGDFVSVHTQELDVPDHMSGIGIYPGEMTDYDPSGAICLAHDVAWDVSGAPLILPKMHRSKLIHHSWKHPKFENVEQIQREIYAFKPDCVLFHASKDGSLIELLRKGKDAPEIPPAPSEEKAPGGGFLSTSDRFAGSNPAPCDPPLPLMTTDQFKCLAKTGQLEIVCDILIKSYPQDYELLQYCLKSIEKFARGFRKVIVVVPDDGTECFDFGLGNVCVPVETRRVTEVGEGYLFQQTVKANAHELTDAAYVLHIDSDCFLTKPITPATFFRNGKPYWLISPYAKIETPWQAATEKFMGEPVEFEFMRRFPFLIPRSLHVAAAAFCLVKHGVTLKDYIMAQPGREFSEFNVLGALAYSRAHGDFVWIDTHAE